jgi:hypothetical protein
MIQIYLSLNMVKNTKIEVSGLQISIFKVDQSEFISLTDIARYKDAEHTDTIIQNWMRNRNTIELLGFWETIYNQNFKPLEFEGFRKQPGKYKFRFNSSRVTSTRKIDTTK